MKRVLNRFKRLSGSRKAVVIALAAAVLAVAVAAAWSPGPRHLSAYGASSGDVSAARAALEADGYAVGNVLTSPHALRSLDAPQRALFVVAGVERAYMESEVAAIVDFVDAGGKVILADDFGYGSAVATHFNVEFQKRGLRSGDFQDNRSLVQVNATLTGESYRLVTNAPSALDVAPGARGRVLATTAAGAFVDNNGNTVEDEGDTRGPFVVAYRVDAGEGAIVFISDPGLLTNGLMEGADNERFVRDLVYSLLPGGGTVVFDESRHKPPLGAGVATVAAWAAVAGTRDTLLAAVTFVAIVGGLALATVLLDPAKDLAIHQQAADVAYRAPANPEALGRRVRRLALLRIRSVHNINVGDDTDGAASRAAVTDEALARLLADPEPRLSETEAAELLSRLEAYAAGGESA